MKVDVKILMVCKLIKFIMCDKCIFLIFFDGWVVEYVKDRKDMVKKLFCWIVGWLMVF